MLYGVKETYNCMYIIHREATLYHISWNTDTIKYLSRKPIDSLHSRITLLLGCHNNKGDSTPKSNAIYISLGVVNIIHNI